MNGFERGLKARFNNIEIGQFTPGLLVDVHVGGRRKGSLAVGETYDFYDLASLTKILFTASAAMQTFADSPRALAKPVRDLLPWWPHESTTPRRLMTHTAGLDWWRPFYKQLHGPIEPEPRWRQLLELLCSLKPKKSDAAVYSDLDLWMMGALLEAHTGLSLLDLWRQTADELELGQLFFHPKNVPLYDRSRYAPTEKCAWRGKILQGEVHDENCWALGGVAPHAGLFGTIDAVSDWGLKIRKAVRGGSNHFRDATMVERFVRRQLPRRVGDWGYCFMKPSEGKASCGRYFHSTSFGHTGFTGTSLWFDPRRDLLVVILSHRVHPTRKNNLFVGLRPEIHNWICELLF